MFDFFRRFIEVIREVLGLNPEAKAVRAQVRALRAEAEKAMEAYGRQATEKQEPEPHPFDQDEAMARVRLAFEARMRGATWKEAGEKIIRADGADGGVGGGQARKLILRYARELVRHTDHPDYLRADALVRGQGRPPESGSADGV